MYIKLGLQMFVKNIVLNLMIILQLSLTVILSNILVCNVYEYTEALRMTNRFPMGSTYMYMPAPDQDRAEERLNRVQEIFSVYGEHVAIERVAQDRYTAQNGCEYEAIGYGDETVKYLHMPLKKGKWLTGVQVENDVPCIVSGNHQLGETINMSLTDTKGCTREIPFVVIGLLDSDRDILKFWTSSNKPGMEMLFEHTTNNNGVPVLLFRQSDLPGADFTPSPSENAIVYLENMETTEKLKLVESLQAQAWFVPFQEAQTESIVQLNLHVKSLLPLILAVFFVGLISVLCLTLLNVIRQMRTFSIYYICGMPWSSGVNICAGYSACHLIGTALVVLQIVCFGNSSGFLPLNDRMLSWWNAAVTLLIIALTLAAALLTPGILLKKQSPLKSLSESW